MKIEINGDAQFMDDISTNKERGERLGSILSHLAESGCCQLSSSSHNINFLRCGCDMLSAVMTCA